MKEKDLTTYCGIYCGDCPRYRARFSDLSRELIQCLCSQGMLETVFSQVTKRAIEVEILKSIGKGDDVCDSLIRL